MVHVLKERKHKKKKNDSEQVDVGSNLRENVEKFGLLTRGLRFLNRLLNNILVALTLAG